MIGKHGIEKDERVNPCEITDAKAMTILCCIELDSFNMKKNMYFSFYSDASTVMWPQTTQGHGQQQPSLSVVTTVWGVTSSMTNGTANMTHDPSNPGIPTTNTVNSVGHPYLSTSANPKPYAQQGERNFHLNWFDSFTVSQCVSKWIVV